MVDLVGRHAIIRRNRGAWIMRKFAILFTILAVVTSISGGIAEARPRPLTPASHLRVTHRTTNAVTLSWNVPRDTRVKAVTVRYAKGLVAPKSPHGGLRLATVHRPKHTVTKARLKPGTRYSFSAFATDLKGHYARAVKLTMSTLRATTSSLNGKWSGTATDPDSSDVETVTFTVKNGALVNFVGWLYTDCSLSLEEVYIKGPAAIKAGYVHATYVNTVGSGSTKVSVVNTVTGFFHTPSSATGFMQYRLVGDGLDCGSEHWDWTATKAG